MPLDLKTTDNINFIESKTTDNQLQELRITGNNGVSSLVTFHTTGNIGIGTTEPSVALQVNGDIQISGTTNMSKLYVGNLYVNGVEVTGGGGGGGGTLISALRSSSVYDSDNYIDFTGSTLTGDLSILSSTELQYTGSNLNDTIIYIYFFTTSNSYPYELLVNGMSSSSQSTSTSDNMNMNYVHKLSYKTSSVSANTTFKIHSTSYSPSNSTSKLHFYILPALS